MENCGWDYWKRTCSCMDAPSSPFMLDESICTIFDLDYPTGLVLCCVLGGRDRAACLKWMSEVVGHSICTPQDYS